MTSSMGRKGSVRQLPNGSWSFVVDLTDPGGVRRQTRRRGFPTRRAAQTALTQVLSSLAESTYVPPQRQTVAAFLTDTWLPAIEHTIKPATFESYRRNVRLHVASRPVGRRQLQDVTPTDLNKMYSELLAGDAEHRPLSARSVRYVATILHRAFRDAVRWQALIRNPAEAADPPRQPDRIEMRTWTAPQLAAFLAHVATDRLAGAWWLLATTGMRRGEALGLRWSEIDLDAGSLRIVRTIIETEPVEGGVGWSWGTPKTAKGRRSVALDPATVAALRQHRMRQLEERLALGAGYADEDLVVCTATGGPIHPKTFSTAFDQRVRSSNLTKIRLHDLRHTHATLALELGVHPRVVQERLGHSQVSVTLDTYSHVSLDQQAAAAARISDHVHGDGGS